jgi:hypothetical protein
MQETSAARVIRKCLSSGQYLFQSAPEQEPHHTHPKFTSPRPAASVLSSASLRWEVQSCGRCCRYANNNSETCTACADLTTYRPFRSFVRTLVGGVQQTGRPNAVPGAVVTGTPIRHQPTSAVRPRVRARGPWRRLYKNGLPVPAEHPDFATRFPTPLRAMIGPPGGQKSIMSRIVQLTTPRLALHGIRLAVQVP